MSFTITVLITVCTKHGQERCTFKNLEEILKNLEEILKTWKIFRKPGENFQKTFGHPVLRISYKLHHLNLFSM